MITRDEYLKLEKKDRFIKLDKTEEERAEELHRKFISIDLHGLILFDEKLLDLEGAVSFSEVEFRVPQIQNSGVTGFFEAVEAMTENFQESMEMLGNYINRIKKHPDFMPAFKAEDFKRAKNEGKQAVMFQIEPQSFEKNLDNVNIAFGLGIRMAILTANTRNYVADGCGERTDEGLSNFGIDIVERMNQVGMLVDISHVGTQSTLDTIEMSKDPIIANHVGARALYPQCKRLKTDEELKALAEKGGVAGVSAIPNQLSGNEKQGINDLLNHIDYMVNLIGINYVGLGLDNLFGDHVELHRRSDGSLFALKNIGQELNAPFMWGIESPEEWPNITRGLVSRGYSDQEIKKILGRNALNLIGRVVG
ncbi:MAG: dipeptidase [Candidatus Hodarchaeales archaeon]|jgi:membrane dipeptidase